MNNYAIIIEYFGINYSGFQIQKNKETIQKVIEEALRKLLNEEIKIIPSGRTDAKVSAENQICSFFSTKKLERYKFLKGINHYLPKDISVKDIIEVEDSFNPRQGAKRKTYRYTILNSIYHSPLNQRCFVTNYNIDLELMKKAAKKIEGKHNFKAFQKVGSSVKTYEREIYEIKIEKVDNFINIDITGNGFLYNMVRIIAGTLFEIAINKIDISVIDLAFKDLNRNVLGKTLPPEGLTLIKVEYGEIDKLWNLKK